MVENSEMEEKRKPKTLEERFECLRQCALIQTSDGNWDCNPYMLGMANGLILALHIMSDSDEECPYLSVPKTFLDDIYPEPHYDFQTKLSTPTKESEHG